MDGIEKLREYKIFGMAAFDLVATFIVAFVVDAIFINTKNKILYYSMVIPSGIFIHYLTKQNTFLNSKILNNEVNGYKIALALSIAIGITSTFHS